MKKVRKLMALVMVLAITLSVLALPVSAASIDEELLTPQAEVRICESCGSAATVKITESKGAPYAEASCTGSNDPAVHQHRKITFTYNISCSACGHKTTKTIERTYCDTTKKYI